MTLFPRNWPLAFFALSWAGLVLVSDQFTKWLALRMLEQAPHDLRVAPFFSITLVWNEGVSFGLMQDLHAYQPYLLSGLAILIVLLLLRWLWRTDDRLIGLGIGLLIGGALGNVIDRLRFGAVIDFMNFHFYPWIFNLADSAVVVAVSLLLVDSFLPKLLRR